MLQKSLIGFWIVIVFALFFYSFTQIDLGLTFTRASIFLDILKSFQYIGYFNRPLATWLYVAIVVLMTVLYLFTLWCASKKKLSIRSVWFIVIVTGVVLGLSYNAFSYDFFNYIFDAKIVTHYNQNPYTQKALDYPSDPMLGFMHWTHRTFPYGPIWLGITIPLSFLGGGIFIVTFYLFKALIVASYFLSVFLIKRIAEKTKIVDPIFAMVFFALSPFVLIEALVSGHIDIVMMAVALTGVYFLFTRKKYVSWVFLLFSIGIKFATVLLLPLFLLFPFSKRKNKEFIFFFSAILLMVVGVYLQAARTTFQPWYFLLVMPFAAFLSKKYYVGIPVTIFSILVLFQYVPFLYNGNFDPPIPTILNQMLRGSIAAAVIGTVSFRLYARLKGKKS